MDVENLDALTPAELDALLEQALNPRVPVEVLYAVLERIGGRAQEPSQPQPLPQAQPHPQVPPRGAATDRAVRPERPRPPKTPTSAQPQTQQQPPPMQHMPPTPPTSQSFQVPPTNGLPGPNPNMQQTTVIPIVPSAPLNDAAPTAVIPIVPGNAANIGPNNAPNTPPTAAPNAAQPSRGAHAPMRHPNPMNPESGY
jgi:hypothetical protein